MSTLSPISYLPFLPVHIGRRINTQFFLERPIGERLNTHSDFFYRGAWLVYTQLFLGVPWVHGSVAPDKSHCQQWTSSLFCGFLPNPFIQDLLLWHTSQEFVKTDLYPWSLISLRYAICLTGCWSITGRCVRACQQSNCAEERRP